MIENNSYRLSSSSAIGSARRADDQVASAFENLLQPSPGQPAPAARPADPLLTSPPYLASEDDDIDYEQALDAAWERGYVDLDDNEDTGPIWAPDTLPRQFA